MKTVHTKPEIPKKRLVIGTIIFILGFFIPLLIPLVVRSGLSTGVKTTLAGILAIGVPEIFMMISVAVLGKDGYNYLKTKVLAFFKKYGPPERVSLLRYRMGLVLFIIPLLIGWLLPYFDHLISAYSEYELFINIGGDVLLIISLFVLGGEFWEKLRSLFIYRSKVVHENRQTDPKGIAK